MLAGSYRWYGNCFCERCFKVFWQQRETSLSADGTGPATGTEVCSLQTKKACNADQATALTLWFRGFSLELKNMPDVFEKNSLQTPQCVPYSTDILSFFLPLRALKQPPQLRAKSVLSFVCVVDTVHDRLPPRVPFQSRWGAVQAALHATKCAGLYVPPVFFLLSVVLFIYIYSFLVQCSLIKLGVFGLFLNTMEL